MQSSAHGGPGAGTYLVPNLAPKHGRRLAGRLGMFAPHDALRRHKFAYRLTTADNGEDMLNMIARLDRDPAEGCPDLFLIDLNLPRRSGDEISLVPAIVITSSDSPQDRARARDLGASYYFRKPADLEKQTRGVPSL